MIPVTIQYPVSMPDFLTVNPPNWLAELVPRHVKTPNLVTNDELGASHGGRSVSPETV